MSCRASVFPWKSQILARSSHFDVYMRLRRWAILMFEKSSYKQTWALKELQVSDTSPNLIKLCCRVPAGGQQEVHARWKQAGGGCGDNCELHVSGSCVAFYARQLYYTSAKGNYKVFFMELNWAELVELLGKLTKHPFVTMLSSRIGKIAGHTYHPHAKNWNN